MARGLKKFKTKNQSKIVQHLLYHNAPYGNDFKLDYQAGAASKQQRSSKPSLESTRVLVDGYVTLDLRPATCRVMNPQRNNSSIDFSKYNRDFLPREL